MCNLSLFERLHNPLDYLIVGDKSLSAIKQDPNFVPIKESNSMPQIVGKYMDIPLVYCHLIEDDSVLVIYKGTLKIEEDSIYVR